MGQDYLEGLTTSLRGEADAADFGHLAETAVRRASRPSTVWAGRLRAKAAAIATALLVLSGFSGLAYAANGSAPDDFLYRLDRALEAVGVANGGASERLAEARSLFAAGQAAQALEHAANAVGEDHATAYKVLLAAAERLEGFEAPGNDDHVSALLEYLSDNIDDVDGQKVADLASQVGIPLEGGPPEGVGPGPPADPGPPGD